MPEFLERRFPSGVRLLFSGLMVVLSVLTKVSIWLWASSIIISDILGWPRLGVIWGVGLVTCLYTMKGGLRAVVYTDALQTAVVLLAAVVLTELGLHAVGGWSGLQAKLPADMFSMVRPATDPDVPWPGMFIGVFILGSFYWSARPTTRSRSCLPVPHGGAGAGEPRDGAAGRGAAGHDHSRRHALAAQRPARGPEPLQVLRDYSLWLGLVLAITTAVWYAMR